MVEVGPGVEYVQVGDICSVPFNISCGRCRNCKEGRTGICLNVNPDRPGSAYGYVDMGGWVGGQAEYVLVPYADWNLLRFPDRDQAMEKIPEADVVLCDPVIPTHRVGRNEPPETQSGNWAPVRMACEKHGKPFVLISRSPYLVGKVRVAGGSA